MIQQELQKLLDIMACLAESERAIARLYRRCAETWKEDDAFWLHLEAQEIGHIRNIDRMAEMIRRNPDRFELHRPFNTTAIRTFITGVEQDMDRLNKGALSQRRALILARDIESSIIEKTYHEIVKTGETDYLNLVKQVVAETCSHKDAIEKRLGELTD